MVKRDTASNQEMYVKVFDFASASEGDIRAALTARKSIFNDGQNYGMPEWQGMEHDELDNPSAIYFVCYAKNGSILGLIRLNPTKYKNYEGSMIAHSFPSTVDGPVPHGVDILEATRIGVAKELSQVVSAGYRNEMQGGIVKEFSQLGPDNSQHNNVLRDKTSLPARLEQNIRKEVVDRLALATLEYGVMSGAKEMIGIMPPGFWKSVYEKRDWPTTKLGTKSQQYGPHPIRDAVSARSMTVSPEVLKRVRDKTGIHEQVCHFAKKLQIDNVLSGKKNDYSLLHT